jgi:acyl carrier protein
MLDERSSVSHHVVRVIADVIRDQGRSLTAVNDDASLLDLGLDSLTMIDLAVALEDALGIQEFPLQQWADLEAARNEPRFTVGALVAACRALVETGALEASHDVAAAKVV